MFRNVRILFLLAAIVTSGSALAAQTAPATSGRATTPAAGRGAAAKPVPVTPADAAPLLGTWEIPLETPTGRLVASLAFRVEGGRVIAGISAPRFPEHRITDITKSGQVVTLKASAEYSGPLANYEGPVTMVLRLTPRGADQAAWFDFNDSGFQLGGTAKKKP